MNRKGVLQTRTVVLSDRSGSVEIVDNHGGELRTVADIGREVERRRRRGPEPVAIAKRYAGVGVVWFGVEGKAA